MYNEKDQLMPCVCATALRKSPYLAMFTGIWTNSTAFLGTSYESSCTNHKRNTDSGEVYGCLNAPYTHLLR